MANKSGGYKSEASKIKDCKIKVIDDLLPKSYFDQIQQMFHPDHGLPWYFNDDCVYRETPESKASMDLWCNENSLNTIESLGNDSDGKKFSRPAGFTHLFTFKGNDLSPFWPFVKPIVDFASLKAGFEYGRILRAKANITLPVPGNKEGTYIGPHVDHSDQSNFITLGFYPFDSDGDTFVFNESHHDGVPEKITVNDRVTPVANRAIVFNGWQYHSASSPIDHNKRIFINFTLEIPENNYSLQNSCME
tara:strand:- start:128 stop:871 length:744 start_codon:yes stop_codon:yes gene_type:complete